MPSAVSRALFTSVVTVVALAVSAPAQCLDWQAFPSTEVDHPGIAHALVVHDDGTGSALFAGGEWYAPGSGWANVGVRRWNGAEWTDVGPAALAGTVYALASFDDGTGSALYAAGRFFLNGDGLQHRVARWDGATWQSLGAFDGDLRAFGVFDAGSGPELYLGGAFTQQLGGPALARVARWDGAAWQPLGAGIGNFAGGTATVHDFAVHDDGAGPKLYVGGRFTHVDGGSLAARHVARWDGSAWSALAGGPLSERVLALEVYDAGAGPELFLGGAFAFTSPSARGFARWTGSAFVPVAPQYAYDCSDLAVLDVGAGPRLYVGTYWANATHVLRYDGATTDVVLADGNQTCGAVQPIGIEALAAFDEGSGPRIFAGGAPGMGSAEASVARWDGASAWERLDAPLQGLDLGVASLCVHDDGSGAALYVGGNFCRAGDHTSRSVTRWNGSTFEPVGLAPSAGTVGALAEHDDGTGLALYAGSYGGLVQRLSSGQWTSIGSGTLAVVHALASFGPRLYAGGTFTAFGGVASPNVIAWDGSAWQALGGGLNGAVQVLAVHDDGSGPAIYAGGSFTGKLARWDGTSWSVVGGGLSADVWALASFDDGAGPALYVGGDFLSVSGGTVPAQRVARWRGGAWSTVGAGLDALVTELCVFDDGSGPKLHAGGNFTHSGAAEMSRVARFDGSAWRALGGGVTGNVTALRSFDDGTGTGAKLFVGGYFSGTPTYASPSLAAWRGCAGEIDRFCFGDGTVVSCPCSNHGLAFRGCDNSRHTGGARLNATGSVSPDSIELYVAGEPPSAATLFFQGDVVLTAPLVFGDGLRCAGGSLKRLYTTQASSGSVAVPPSGGLSISARSAALGDPLVPGAVRAYQTWYRDSDPTFCAAPAGNAWNLSNAVRIVW